MAQTPNGKPGPISSIGRNLYDSTTRQEVDTTPTEQQLRSHPDFAQSLIPVLGPADEAIADLYDHDYLGAAFNAGLTIADLALSPAVLRAVGTAAVKKTSQFMAPAVVKAAMRKASEIRKDGKAPYSWRNTRDRMKARGDVKPYQEVHHWLIPQRAKSVPDRIRNHPLNLKIMPEGPAGRTTHARIHHGVGKKNTPQRLERFNPLQRYIYGTPTWLKATNLGAGHATGAAKAEWDKAK